MNIISITGEKDRNQNKKVKEEGKISEKICFTLNMSPVHVVILTMTLKPRLPVQAARNR